MVPARPPPARARGEGAGGISPWPLALTRRLGEGRAGWIATWNGAPAGAFSCKLPLAVRRPPGPAPPAARAGRGELPPASTPHAARRPLRRGVGDESFRQGAVTATPSAGPVGTAGPPGPHLPVRGPGPYPPHWRPGGSTMRVSIPRGLLVPRSLCRRERACNNGGRRRRRTSGCDNGSLLRSDNLRVRIT
jgi:hypothetical protein